MSAYNFLVERVVLPMSDSLFKRSIAQHLRFLRLSEHWSEQELEAYQDERLRALVRHAYNNVPFYRSVFKARKLTPADIQRSTDLRKLPILKKADLRSNFPEGIVDSSYPMNQIIKHSSSGSTGQPLTYYVSNDAYSFNIACNLRGWYWMGYRLGDRFLKISQYDRPLHKRVQDLALRTKYVSSADLSEVSFQRMVELFRVYRPSIIRCYPDPLYFIAGYMRRHGITDVSPDAVTTTGSVLLPHVRDEIEDVFGCPVFDSYRCEGGANAFESPDRDCYISSMEYGISEILNSDGEEVTEGESGTLITTDLHNYAMPFIRYDSQDIVTKHNGKSRSGHNHLALSKIDGRNTDILVTPAGQYLIVIHFVDYFDKFDSVDQFQIQQTRRDQLVFNLKVNDLFNPEVERDIVDYWTEYTSGSMEIIIDPVEEISLTRMGKRRFLVRAPEIPVRV